MHRLFPQLRRNSGFTATVVFTLGQKEHVRV
jgi:hypothetical protein